jgi:hypothetical protein
MSDEARAILPCPFCGGVLVHVESVARSFTPHRIYHEIKHPPNACLLTHWRWSFTDDPAPRLKWVEQWNRRAANG